MASSLNNSAWIEWIGKLVGGSRQAYAATLPPDCFYCLLDDLPLHLIPRRNASLLHAGYDQQEQLFLNPDCIFCANGQLPEELANEAHLVSGFALAGTIAWVRDPLTATFLPFWLGPELEGLLGSLRSHELVPYALPKHLLSPLLAAGILVNKEQIARRNRERAESITRASRLFQEKDYSPLNNLIHPFHIAALRRYYRYLIRTGAVPLGDRQSSRRYVAYNESVARFFHRQMASVVSMIAGEPVKPSYVYLASYLSGAELKKHTDREQCEFSVTLCLDFSPEPVLETPWPIRLDTSDNACDHPHASTVTVYQAIGDGLAYRGTRLPHYRDVLAEDQTSTSIFFHYVAADFTGSLD
jgi:hypothetical protein